MKFQQIKKYMLKPRSERQAHLNLRTRCIEVGGDSKQFRGLLAHTLQTTIPQGVTIYLCHACGNGRCSNPNHLYWGTPSENNLDQYVHGRPGRGGFWSMTPEGKEHARRLGKKYGAPLRLSPGKLKQIRRVIDTELKTVGWKGRAAKKLGVSHTQLRRYLKKFGLVA